MWASCCHHVWVVHDRERQDTMQKRNAALANPTRVVCGAPPTLLLLSCIWCPPHPAGQENGCCELRAVEGGGGGSVRREEDHANDRRRAKAKLPTAIGLFRSVVDA